MILEDLYFRNRENFRCPPESWELRAQIRPSVGDAGNPCRVSGQRIGRPLLIDCKEQQWWSTCW